MKKRQKYSKEALQKLSLDELQNLEIKNATRANLSAIVFNTLNMLQRFATAFWLDVLIFICWIFFISYGIVCAIRCVKARKTYCRCYKEFNQEGGAK